MTQTGRLRLEHRHGWQGVGWQMKRPTRVWRKPSFLLEHGPSVIRNRK